MPVLERILHGLRQGSHPLRHSDNDPRPTRMPPAASRAFAPARG